MLLSDDAPCDGVSGRCQANPLFALNGAIVIRVDVRIPVGVSQRCAAYVLRRLRGLLPRRSVSEWPRPIEGRGPTCYGPRRRLISGSTSSTTVFPQAPLRCNV